MERLDRPDKNWKYNPGDVDERMLWPRYQEAYQAALEKCSTPEAPWFVVPADRKWYARLAVQNLVLEHLRAMDPQLAGRRLRRRDGEGPPRRHVMPGPPCSSCRPRRRWQDRSGGGR